MFITKILIIRFSSIGDVVLTTPIVRCLKKQLDGESEIHYLVKPQYAEILKNNPNVDVVHTLADQLSETADKLMDEGFHYVIDLHKNIRSRYIIRKLNTMSFTFDKLNIKKWILVNFNIDLLPDIHIVDRYFEAVKALGIENDGHGIDYFIPYSSRVVTKDVFDAKQGKYIAFCIGGAHAGKKLPVHKMVELCQLIDKKIVLLGGKEDEEAGKQIQEKNENVSSLCGQLTLNQSASVIEQAGLVITHDSGLMHIASAFKKTIISIWGATVPKFGMYPYLPDEDSVMIQADHLKFRPTSKLGNKSSKKERRTTEEIDLNQIKEAVKKLMK